jgi:2,5-diketo-D-gluconate reductase A
VNQVETHPFNQQTETQRFLQENGVQHESWGPFAEGKHNIFKNEVLHSIAERHGKTVAQVILRWLTQRGIVVIPKSVRPERMAENFDVFGFELSPEDLAAVATLDRKESSFFDHRDPEMAKALGRSKLDI